MIRRRVTLLDAEALHLAVNVFVHVTLRNHQENGLTLFEESVQDIPEIVEHFLGSNPKIRRLNKSISQAALERMGNYNWPGNVRELRNIVERAVILSGCAPTIEPAHLAFCAAQPAKEGVAILIVHERALPPPESGSMSLYHIPWGGI